MNVIIRYLEKKEDPCVNNCLLRLGRLHLISRASIIVVIALVLRHQKTMLKLYSLLACDTRSIAQWKKKVFFVFGSRL